MPILDPSGRPIYPAYPAPETPAQVAKTIPPPFKPTRQLIRGYLRMVAKAHINHHFGLEPRPLRRKLAFSLAKREQFINEVRNATKAW